MKRILYLIAVMALVTLSSCLVIIAGPELEIDVDFSGSSSYDGYYEIDLSIQNTGYAKAYISDYYVELIGSTGSPIAFDIAGPDVEDLNAGETQYLTLYGYSAIYVPYGFEIIIEYAGAEGSYRTVEASGEFTVGDPGTPFVAYAWSLSPFTYTTDDPGIPDLIYNGQYYETHPGTYSFWYQAWDGTAWAGTYTIYRDTGDAGVDGNDYFFELECLNTGPSFIIRTYAANVSTAVGTGLQQMAEESDTVLNGASGEIASTEGHIGPFRYTLDYWKAE